MRARFLLPLCSALLFCAVPLPTLTAAHAAQPKAAAESRLELASASALVVDLGTGRELYSSLPDVQVPIASITKLMTAMVMLDARQPMDALLPVTIRDTRELKGVFSRVRVGSVLSRRELLRLSLMSSENRAASTLAHHYPGGHAAFVAAMNAKARALGMGRTRFVEPTGLSPLNLSTARELVTLVKAARQYPLIREMSTYPSGDAFFRQPNYALSFFNTNPLVRKGGWNIQLSKTGFTNDAGHCLVMLADVDRRPVAMVLLDSYGKQSRFGDASRVRTWLETGRASPIPAVARDYRNQKQRQLQQVALSRR